LLPRARAFVGRGLLAAVLLGLALAGCGAASAQGARPERRALLIGVSKYDGFCAPGDDSCKGNNLDGPVYDVAALQEVLQSRFGYASADITVLLDSAARKPAVLAALHELASWAGPGREVFIYFSGHGTGPLDPGGAVPLPDQSGALVLAPPGPRPGKDVGSFLLKEMFLVGRTEVRPVLEEMDRKGASVIAVLDACFSQNTFRAAAPKQKERRFHSKGLAAAFPPIDTSRLRTGATTTGQWPYHHVTWISAASANETAIDLPGPTLDGKPHGALTDALLRVLTGKEPYQDANGHGALSYAELFAAAESYMRRQQYPQTPQVSPSPMTDDPQAAAVLELPVFGRGLPAGRAAAADTVKVSLSATAGELRRALSGVKGIELTEASAEYRIEASAAQWKILTGQGESVLTTESGTPQLQDADRLLESMRMRAALRRLTAAANARSAGLEVTAGSAEQSVGGTVLAGQPVSMVLRASRDVTVALVQIMGDGSTRVWLPAIPGEQTCSTNAHIAANARTVLCTWGGSAAPYGLDLLYVLAAEGSSQPLAGITDRELTPAVLRVLENVVAHHPGRVAMLERQLFTVGRQ